jgi:hypothetical protein
LLAEKVDRSSINDVLRALLLELQGSEALRGRVLVQLRKVLDDDVE